VNKEDGVTRWIVATGHVYEEQGKAGRLIGTVQDVTEQKRAEQELLEQNRYLEQEDRRKEFFLATLGHELRNPLAALDGAIRVLARGGRSAAELQPMMTEHVAQLTNLINDLLDVSRVTRGRITLHKVRMDMTQAVKAAAAAVRSSVRAKEQELEIDMPEAVYIHGDRTRLEQVVANLLSNATKYTGEGGRIAVGLRCDDEEVELVVRDEGRGLTQQQIENAFEPFTQENPGEGGLGIGLPLVRGLVELHGGSVSAESDGPGTGCTFTVRFPVGECEESDAEESAPQAESSLPSRPRVLIVDDVRDAADMLALLLQSQGAETRCAYGGQEAIDLAREWRPSIALVDIGLPDMSGYEVARSVRSQLGASAPRLIAVTGYGQPTDRAAALEAGFDVHLVKPASADQLLRALCAPPDEARVAT
jgi:CheY-like chemotaxis protein